MTPLFAGLQRDISEMTGEQIEYRDLLVRITQRDLLLRYKQTGMGFGWAVCMPLINTAVFSVIFTRVTTIETGVPYPLFAYTGLLVWNFFASSLRFSVVSLTSNASLITKVYFPREIFPFSPVLVSLVDMAVGSLVLVAMMTYYGITPSWSLLALLLVIAVHVAFTAGIALLLAMGNLFYRDVKHLFEVVISVWMFATSVVYPVELVGGHLGAALKLNPMTPIIDAYRAVLLNGRVPLDGLAVSAVLALGTLAVAWYAFHRGEFLFAERI